MDYVVVILFVSTRICLVSVARLFQRRQFCSKIPEKIQVWMDEENVSIPDGKSLKDAVEAIKRGLKARKIYLEPSITLVAPRNRVERYMHEFAICKVRYIETKVGKQIADGVIKGLMREWKEANPYPKKAMLVSSDKDYVDPLEDLNEQGHEVLVVARLCRTRREIVRIIRLWKLPKHNNPHTYNIEMIILDEKLDRIHCTVPSSLITQLGLVLEEGQSYRIEKLKVNHNDAKFPTTPHKYRLNFIARTKCSRIENESIPLNRFFFISFANILASQPKNRRIVDIIGHVVEKSELRAKKENNKLISLIEFVLEDLEFKRIHCTLSGELAEMMACSLSSIGSSFSSVVIVQLCRLKKYQGNMGIENAFHGTRLFIDADLEAVKDYKSKMEAVHGGYPTEHEK